MVNKRCIGISLQYRTVAAPRRSVQYSKRNWSAELLVDQLIATSTGTSKKLMSWSAAEQSVLAGDTKEVISCSVGKLGLRIRIWSHRIWPRDPYLFEPKYKKVHRGLTFRHLTVIRLSKNCKGTPATLYHRLCWPTLPMWWMIAKNFATIAKRYFSTLKEPRNRFHGINSASLCSLGGRYDNPIPTRFLVPVNCSKSTDQLNQSDQTYPIYMYYFLSLFIKLLEMKYITYPVTWCKPAKGQGPRSTCW